MSQPAAVRSLGVSVFTEPAVPTGMNAGVSTSPWDVVKRPARALVDGSSASSWNEKGIRGLARRARGTRGSSGTGEAVARPGTANVRATGYGRASRGVKRRRSGCGTSVILTGVNASVIVSSHGPHTDGYTGSPAAGRDTSRGGWTDQQPGRGCRRGPERAAVPQAAEAG